MRRVVRDLAVRRSSDVVWTLVGDVDHFDRFFVGLTKWEAVTPPKHAVGDQYWVHLQVGSTAVGGQVRVTTLDDDEHRLAWTAATGTEHTVEIRIEDEGPDACRIHFDVRYGLSGPGAPLVEWLAEPIVRRNVVATLESLRHLAEHELREEHW